jgi:hypothetical protein
MQLILSFLVLEFHLAVSLAFLDFCVEPEEQERLTGKFCQEKKCPEGKMIFSKVWLENFVTSRTAK